MRVGETLRRARLAAGLTQAKLGAMVGRCSSWVCKVERSVTLPGIKDLEAFMDAVDTDERHRPDPDRLATDRNDPWRRTITAEAAIEVAQRYLSKSSRDLPARNALVSFWTWE